MQEFKAGDKLVCVRGDNFSLMVGKTYTFERYSLSGRDEIFLEELGSSFFANRFELVPDLDSLEAEKLELEQRISKIEGQIGVINTRNEAEKEAKLNKQVSLSLTHRELVYLRMVVGKYSNVHIKELADNRGLTDILTKEWVDKDNAFRLYMSFGRMLGDE